MKLRCTINEHGLQPLLNKLPFANNVTLVTYSLERSYSSDLLEALRQLKDGARLTLITNIPSRFDRYYGNQKSKAKKGIEEYLRNLNPDSLNWKADVRFSFKNHSKILIVDGLAYVGSANFTEGSANSFEAGVLLSDKEQIAELEQFVEKIKKTSIPYLSAAQSTECTPLLELALSEVKIIESIRYENELIPEEYSEWEHDLNQLSENAIYIPGDIDSFFDECHKAAESLIQNCGTDDEVLPKEILDIAEGFFDYMNRRGFEELIPKQIDDGKIATDLTEELINTCSNDGNVTDVMNHPIYQERLNSARNQHEIAVDSAIKAGLTEITERIQSVCEDLRRAFSEGGISPEIDNT